MERFECINYNVKCNALSIFHDLTLRGPPVFWHQWIPLSAPWFLNNLSAVTMVPPRTGVEKRLELLLTHTCLRISEMATGFNG